MPVSAVETIFFVTGGTMPPGAPSYVERPADEQLCQGLLQGEFCYVLTSRQMGKSSLMVRTANRLRAQGVTILVLDLTAIGTNVTPEQWYDGLLMRMGRLLRLEDELEEFWEAQQRAGPLQRLMTALHDVILPALGRRAADSSGQEARARLVVFVDEIDMVRSLPFPTDEFFAAIRECYNRRVEEPEFKRLTFCLLGVATPSDLIRDPHTTPFNIGRRIELTDFTLPAAAPLLAGWQRGQTPGARSLEDAQGLLERVLYWTGGHPYLTQRLSHAIASRPELRRSADVDQMCETMFFCSRAREQEDNLLFVRERILRTEASLREVLKLYQKIWRGEQVRDDETNRLIDTLRLSGIVRLEQGHLVVRNRIYHRVFNDDWIAANLPPAQEPEPNSIGVLPFRVIAPDNSCEFLADGLTDELISALGRVPELRVASRTSAFQFKGQTDDIRTVGARLLVQYVLEGSLRPVGPDAQISARLVRTSNGHCAWSETYRHPQHELAQVQDKMAAAIVGQLASELGCGPRVLAAPQPVVNTGAYNVYLKGRFHWNKRTESAVRRSIELFQEAIQKEPRFALAHAGLADAFNILGTYNYARPLDAYPKAKAAALSALQLDPNLAQAHCALGCTSSVHDWDWKYAEHEFRQAIQLNPSYATAHQWLAINCLTPLGRHEEALAALRRAQEVDPLSISITASIGLAHYFAGRIPEAIDQCRQAVDMDPAFWVGQLFLGWACVQQQLLDEAVDALQASLQGGNRDPVVLAALAHAHAVRGDRTAAMAGLAELEKMAQTRYVPAMDLVPVHLALEDWEGAFHWLEQAVLERSFKLIYCQVDPRLLPLRDHPRARQIFARTGLSEVS